MGDVTIRLSALPPSVNALYKHGRGGRVYISERYRKWQRNAGWELQTQRPPKIAGPVSISISMREPRTRSDADNRIKGAVDLLVTHGVIPDDNREIVRNVSAKWSPDVKGCEITVRSTPAPAAQAQLGDRG